MATIAPPKIHDTAIDIAENVRATLVDLLNATLADLSDLKSQTKYAHWNVKGPNFFSLHKLFDELAGGFDAQIDDVAERITTLGGTAAGTSFSTRWISVRVNSDRDSGGTTAR